MKVRKTVAQNRFIHLCDALGKRVAKSYSDVGGWRLDKGFGGYSIEEISNSSGGVTHPFGPRRLSSSELCEAINMMLRAVQLDRLNGAPSASYWPEDKITNPKAA